jgi:bisphosphoglycerate-independent phosphoglycerate mutase (AlkP superfamily)
MADLATGQPHAAHTTNPVPLIVYDPKFQGGLPEHGTLADVAPTLLAKPALGVIAHRRMRHFAPSMR